MVYDYAGIFQDIRERNYHSPVTASTPPLKFYLLISEDLDATAFMWYVWGINAVEETAYIATRAR